MAALFNTDKQVEVVAVLHPDEFVLRYSADSSAVRDLMLELQRSQELQFVEEPVMLGCYACDVNRQLHRVKLINRTPKGYECEYVDSHIGQKVTAQHLFRLPRTVPQPFIHKLEGLVPLIEIAGAPDASNQIPILNVAHNTWTTAAFTHVHSLLKPPDVGIFEEENDLIMRYTNGNIVSLRTSLTSTNLATSRVTMRRPSVATSPSPQLATVNIPASAVFGTGDHARAEQEVVRDQHRAALRQELINTYKSSPQSLPRATQANVRQGLREQSAHQKDREKLKAVAECIRLQKAELAASQAVPALSPPVPAVWSNIQTSATPFSNVDVRKKLAMPSCVQHSLKGPQISLQPEQLSTSQPLQPSPPLRPSVPIKTANSHTVFVHSTDATRDVPEPVRDETSHVAVIRELSTPSYQTLSPLQRSVIPIISGLDSCFLVGEPVDAAYAWLPVVLSNTSVSAAQNRCGGKRLDPLLVIVTSSARNVEFIEQLVETWKTSQMRYNLSVRAQFEVPDNARGPRALSCDILISTADPLHSTGGLLYTRQCRHLVLHDVPFVWRHYSNMIRLMTNRFQEVALESEQEFVPIQVICTATEWDTESRQVLHLVSSKPSLMRPPTLVMSSYLDAALWAGVSQSVCYTSDQSRVSRTFELVQAAAEKPGAVAVIARADDKADVHTALLKVFPTLLALESVEELVDQQAFWESKAPHYPIVMIQNESRVMEQLSLTSFTHIVLLDNTSKLDKKMKLVSDHFTANPGSISVQHVLSPHSDGNLVSIYCTLQRCIVTLMPELVARVDEIREATNKDPKVAVCPSLLQYGDCLTTRCQRRHRILPGDQYANMPKSGTLTVVVTAVHSPVHVSVLVRSHTPGEGGEEYTNPNKMLPLRVARYFAKERPKPNMVEEGDILGVDVKERGWLRVKVINMDNYPDVAVRCIDTGEDMVVKEQRLRSLSPELIMVPPMCLHLFLLGFKSRDAAQPISWPRGGCPLAENLWKCEARCEIVASLKDYIFVHTLYKHEKLATARTQAITFCWRSLVSDYAVVNPLHLRKIRELCRDAGLEYNKPAKMEAVKPPSSPEFRLPPQRYPQGQLRDIEEDRLSAFLSSVHDPQYFHLIQDKEIPRLAGMEHALNTRELHPLQRPPARGMHVVAAAEYNPGWLRGYRRKWQRAVIINLDPLEVNFVDFGDFDVVQRENIVRPVASWDGEPRIAVHCLLGAVEPSGTDWSDASVERLWNLAHTEKEDWKLGVKVYKSEMSPALGTPVELYGTRGAETNLPLSYIFIRDGYAQPNWTFLRECVLPRLELDAAPLTTAAHELVSSITRGQPPSEVSQELISTATLEDTCAAVKLLSALLRYVVDYDWVNVITLSLIRCVEIYSEIVVTVLEECRHVIVDQVDRNSAILVFIYDMLEHVQEKAYYTAVRSLVTGTSMVSKLLSCIKTELSSPQTDKICVEGVLALLAGLVECPRASSREFVRANCWEYLLAWLCNDKMSAWRDVVLKFINTLLGEERNSLPEHISVKLRELAGADPEISAVLYTWFVDEVDIDDLNSISYALPSLPKETGLDVKTQLRDSSPQNHEVVCPSVKWAQSRDHIVLTFVDFVEKRDFTFTALDKEIHFACGNSILNWTLLNDVDQWKSRFTSTGLRVTLQKKSSARWQSLLASSRRPPSLAIDADYIIDSDSEAEEGFACDEWLERCPKVYDHKPVFYGTKMMPDSHGELCESDEFSEEEDDEEALAGMPKLNDLLLQK